MANERQSIFSKYTKNVVPVLSPLRSRSEISFLLDVLERKLTHHVILTVPSSIKLRQCVQETLAYCLSSDEKPNIAVNAKIVFFDAAEFSLQNDGPLTIENNFLDFCKELQNQNVIFIMNQMIPLTINDSKSPLASLAKCLRTILSNPHWRLLFLTDDIPSEQKALLQDHFSIIELSDLSFNELKAILLLYKQELEAFHHVEIPNETAASALMLAHYYLSPQHSLDKAYELLESARARMGNNDTVLTNAALTEVISDWACIPLSHLQNNKFEANKFLETVQRTVLGQQGGLTLIASSLQRACVQLQKKSAPFCSFLFAGPADTGKTTAVYAIAEHLFGHAKVVLQITTHLNVKFNGRLIQLIEAVKKMPFAILLFENVDQHLKLAAELFELIARHEEVFCHTIVILTTRLGSDTILPLFQNKPEETPQTLDLLELVLNDKTHEMPVQPTARMPDEINEIIIPQLESVLSKEILDKHHLIPFIPLEYAAVENLVRIKIKELSKLLEERHETELLVAPEVIKFLAHEIYWRNPHRKQLDKLLDQHLNSCIAHGILTQSEDNNRAKRLSLKLHDNGHMLRCDSISTMQKTSHTAEL